MASIEWPWGRREELNPYQQSTNPWWQNITSTRPGHTISQQDLESAYRHIQRASDDIVDSGWMYFLNSDHVRLHRSYMHGFFGGGDEVEEVARPTTAEKKKRFSWLT